jgi:enoyl-[acyl-carrier protein] reductase II
MCGAMTWVSDPKLVSAVANCGGFRLIAGGNAPVEVLKNQIIETRQMTDHPFGANIITLAPAYKDQFNLVCDMECEFIVFAGGIPKKNEIQQAKKAGAKAICFASTAPLAIMLIERGTDALILEGSEIDGDVTKGSLMAGQSVGLVDKVKPLKGIIDEMIDDAESELKWLQQIFIAESA